MDWITEFLNAFAQESDSNNYLMKDQRTMVRDYNNISNQNMQQTKEDNDHLEMKGQDPQTGEDFALDIKGNNEKPKNKKEEEWIKREMTVTFTSLNNKDKFVSATLGSLCGGKYAHLVDKPISEIGDMLIKDANYIFNYADSSIASYSDRITSEQAFRISKSIAEQNKISYFDYEKICSKLNTDHIDGFNAMLKSSNIKIAYPMQVLENEIDTIHKEKNNLRLANEKVAINKKVNYYMDLFKSFKEYKLADSKNLKIRISAVIPLINADIKNLVIEELGKDNLTKDII